MKRRPYLLILILCVAAVAALLSGALSGCAKNSGIESIQVEDTHVYMAPMGEPSTYQINAVVYPVETASQKVYYKLADGKDSKYLTVSTTGLITATAEKKDDEGNIQDVFIKVVSATDSSVSVTLTVTIETVAVERITFDPSEIRVSIHGGTLKLKPIFYPAHAITGRNVTYESLNTGIASVAADGTLTPVGIGNTTIVVRTPKTTSSDKTAIGYLQVKVKYDDLNYRLDVASGVSALKQIAGKPEPISFVINSLDDFCDPSPSISWFVGNSAINDDGVKDSKTYVYTPTNLPRGTYVIRAVLSNSFERTELFSPTIYIYDPLSAISCDVLDQTDSYTIGDTLALQVSFSEDEYPPESYAWKVTSPGGTVESINRIRSSSSLGDLYYEFTEAGTYYFQAEAIVKGEASGVFSEIVEIEVEAPRGVTDIDNVYIEGIKVGDGYNVYVGWDPLPYETVYTVEIKFRGVDGEAIVPYTSYEYPEYFYKSGMYIPASTVTLADSFSVRVRSGSEYDFSEWKSYTAGTISAGQYEYLEDLTGYAQNSYISSVYELADLVNYLAVFRPEPIVYKTTVTIGGEATEVDAFTLSLYIPFLFSELGPYYPEAANPAGSGGAGENNWYKIMYAAMASYGETYRWAYSHSGSWTPKGRNSFTFCIVSEGNPTEASSLLPYGSEQGNAHYAATPHGADAVLPIDSVEATMNVSTSSGLYYAVSHGFKPICQPGSPAETIYLAAREILYSICGDDQAEAEKVHSIYDYLVMNIRYADDVASLAEELASSGGIQSSSYNAFFLEGVFVDKVAVCDGLAKAFALLCQMEGIHAVKVAGTAGTSAVSGHAWNRTLVDGYWYVSDSTWGYKGSYGSGTHEQLLMTDQEAEEERNAQAQRITYGKYPPSAAVRSFIYYDTVIDADNGYDLKIGSDEELSAFAQYLVSALGSEDVYWCDFYVEYTYLVALYNAHFSGGSVTLESYLESELLYATYISNFVRNGAGEDYNLATYFDKQYFYFSILPAGGGD